MKRQVVLVASRCWEGKLRNVTAYVADSVKTCECGTLVIKNRGNIVATLPPGTWGEASGGGELVE